MLDDDGSRQEQRRRCSRWDEEDREADVSRERRSGRASAGTSGRSRHDRFDDDEHRQHRHHRRRRSLSPQRRRRSSRSRSRSRSRDHERESCDRNSSRRVEREEEGHERRRDERDNDGIDFDDRRRRETRDDGDDERRRRDATAATGFAPSNKDNRSRKSRWAAIDASADAGDAATARERGRLSSFSAADRGGGSEEETKRNPPPPPQQPQFGLSGALAAETNTTAEGVTLLHAPPADAAPAPGASGRGVVGAAGGGVASDGGRRWRLYVFKDGKELVGGGSTSSAIPLVGPSSSFLFGRDRRVADIPTDHGSCSKQHAVIQFRRTTASRRGPSSSSAVASVPPSRPYLMDLGSTNGTFLNGKRIESLRYHELLPKDVVRFGESTREYVVLTEESV